MQGRVLRVGPGFPRARARVSRVSSRQRAIPVRRPLLLGLERGLRAARRVGGRQPLIFFDRAGRPASPSPSPPSNRRGDAEEERKPVSLPRRGHRSVTESRPESTVFESLVCDDGIVPRPLGNRERGDRPGGLSPRICYCVAPSLRRLDRHLQARARPCSRGPGRSRSPRPSPSPVGSFSFARSRATCMSTVRVSSPSGRDPPHPFEQLLPGHGPLAVVHEVL